MFEPVGKPGEARELEVGARLIVRPRLHVARSIGTIDPAAASSNRRAGARGGSR
jgi:hypothetical protein